MRQKMANVTGRQKDAVIKRMNWHCRCPCPLDCYFMLFLCPCPLSLFFHCILACLGFVPTCSFTCPSLRVVSYSSACGLRQQKRNNDEPTITFIGGAVIVLLLSMLRGSKLCCCRAAVIHVVLLCCYPLPVFPCLTSSPYLYLHLSCLILLSLVELNILTYHEKIK